MNSRFGHRGFTLIELLAVIATIAILATLAFAQPIRADAAGATNSIKNSLQNLSVEIAMIDHDRILNLADQALTSKPSPITDHVATNSAGGVHDFFSQADYAWPNPTNRTGLPYIGRDGESNPDTFTYHRMATRNMKDAVAALAAAYALTGDDRYVTKAAGLLRVFFLDAKTRMNPHLRYAQAVLGASTGNAYGVIDTLHLAELPVAVGFLEKSVAFPPEVDQGLKKWFANYSDWIITSTNGVKEMNNPNNHSIACFVQLASFAKFTGDEKLLKMCRRRFKEVLFPGQMTNNGSFPRELARTKPYGYSIFQADNLATLCVLLSTRNDDVWKFTLPDGRTPRNAVDFIYPYLANKNQWLAEGRRKDVMHWENWPARQSCLIFAYAEFDDEKYLDLWKKLNADPSDLEIRRNMAITQPLLWIASPDEVPLSKNKGKRANARSYSF
jgi:prepilin-type N-terminal cleavage/methylation domain-containing protein